MIYIDSDDVAADWVGYVCGKHLGGISRDEMNKLPDLTVRLKNIYTVDRHLFMLLKPLEGFSEMFKAILDSGEDYRILTVGAKGLHSCNTTVKMDKELWWLHHYSVPLDKVILVDKAANKPKYAKSPTDILIDDRLSTVEKFVKAGGSGIHIPREPEHSPERIAMFKEALSDLLNLEVKNNRYILLK